MVRLPFVDRENRGKQMNVPLITELVVPKLCGFKGGMPKARAVAMLRLYADMVEEDAAGEVDVNLYVRWEDLPAFKIVRYSPF